MYRSGFTLIELLIVIGIIGTLASVTIVAINPNKQLNSAKDTARLSAIRELRNALTQYQIDNGSFPAGTPAQGTRPVCKAGVTTDTTCVNLDALVPKYLVSLPQESAETNPNYTGYVAGVLGGRAHAGSAYYGNAGNYILSGLVGWWKFDEAGGTTATDASGNGANGTLMNGPARVTGKFANALNFNGAAQYVALPASGTLDLQAFTIAAWINVPTYAQNGFIFEKTTNGLVNTQYSFFINGNSWFYCRTEGTVGGQHDVTFDTVAGSLTANTWYHVACVYDGTKKHIYINGVERAVSTTYTDTLYTNPAGTSFIGIYGGGGYPFNGMIDDVRIYNRGLSAAELLQIYAGNG